jgi:uncharacterized membrane protein YoaK (UPF0700 family)
MATYPPGPPSDNPGAIGVLLVLLSVIAGCTDVIGFLALDGLFTAHVTGNVVLLAAHAVQGGAAPVAKLLAVPVFVAAAGLSALLASALESSGRASLRPLLSLQLLLLAGFLVAGVATGPRIDANAPVAVLAGMLGVAAMAVQNVLVQVSLAGAPSTAVMTSNVTRFAVDIADMLLGGAPAHVARTRSRAARVLPVIVGFVAGCGLGAASEAALGVHALAVPCGLALLALAIGVPAAEAMEDRFRMKPGRPRAQPR